MFTTGNLNKIRGMGSDSCEGMTLQSNWDIGSLASTTSMGYKRTGDLIIFVDHFGI